MKTILTIGIPLLVGFVVALLLTSVAWQLQIEGKAYECNDSIGPFATFETDMSRHRNAGDTLRNGWTWERIENVGKIYQIIFYGGWLLVSCILFVFFRK